MGSKSWHTPSALAWMQIILQERFGHSFIFQLQADDRRLALRLPGDDDCITLTVDGSIFTCADSDMPCSNWDAAAEGWLTALKPVLPAPGVSTLPPKLIESTGNGSHIHYDIMGMTYWMLTRQEEFGRTDLDIHGRFPATSSHAFKHGYLERPIVDEWLYIFGQVVNRTWPNLILRRHEFRVQVSHDVDQPSLYAFKSWAQIVRMMGGDLIKRRNLKAFFKTPFVKLASRSSIHQADPFNTFDWIMDQSERNGLKSAFYFICGKSDPHDADYHLGDPRICGLMTKISFRGHELGLHPSYSSYLMPEMILCEAENLRKICNDLEIKQDAWGGRMHYLRWNSPVTLRALENARLNYDSSLGYADRPGFRCGTCFEYPGFDFLDNKILNIRIRPLIVMETTVIEENYLGLGVGKEAVDLVLLLKNACRRLDGVFNMLWHNSSLLLEEERSMYLKLLSRF